MREPFVYLFPCVKNLPDFFGENKAEAQLFKNQLHCRFLLFSKTDVQIYIKKRYVKSNTVRRSFVNGSSRMFLYTPKYTMVILYYCLSTCEKTIEVESFTGDSTSIN